MPVPGAQTARATLEDSIDRSPRTVGNMYGVSEQMRFRIQADSYSICSSSQITNVQNTCDLPCSCDRCNVFLNRFQRHRLHKKYRKRSTYLHRYAFVFRTTCWITVHGNHDVYTHDIRLG